jgi:hypothetical protein
MRSVARWPNADSRAELEFPRHLLYAWVTRVTKWSMVWCRQPIFFYFFSPLQFPRQTLLFSKQSFNLFCIQIYTFEYFVLFKWNWNWFLISSFLNSFLFLVLILLITIFFVFYIFFLIYFIFYRHTLPWTWLIIKSKRLGSHTRVRPMLPWARHPTKFKRLGFNTRAKPTIP